MEFSSIFNMNIDEEKLKEYINEMKQIRKQLLKKEIPESYPNEMSNPAYILAAIEEHSIFRDSIINISAFPLISKDWICELIPLLKNKKCLEIMSGKGVLSKALADEGIDIIATDIAALEFNKTSLWYSVESLSASEAVDKYVKQMDYIICSWIPYGSDAGTEVLLKMRKLNPECKMIYIGEMGECCANERFVRECEVIHDDHIVAANEKFKQWSGIHDRIYLLK